MFGQPGNGELLLGRGFDGSVANGFGNDSGNNSNNNSTAAGGSTGSSAFDLNDFPSLGGGAGGNSATAGDNNSLAAALRHQQQLLAQQQQVMQSQSNSNKVAQSSNLYRLAMGNTPSNSANFNMATEDFPALPGAPPLGSGGVNSGSGLLGGVEGGQRELSGSSTPGSTFTTSAQSASRTSNGSGAGIFGGNEIDGLTNQLESTSLLGGGGLGNLVGNQSSSNSGLSQQQRQTSSHQSSGPVPAPSGNSVSGGPNGGSALSGDFGLLGLLAVIRMTDADRNALALGSDLTSLGLNLNSSDQLYSTFASPWSESPTNREPQYQLPMCYYMQPPALKTGHLSKFQLETLFYIFYALPRDVLQAYAAQELYSREWKYHVDLKLWFKRASPADGVTNTGGGVQFIYFDINSWERRLFNGNMNQNITSGLLPEDDIRVKFSSP
mmetsp:Transcript_11157/g.14084  ORF Transcript_11157/g.14084 Transcript_11157/m.14084 type:complete len:438 (-) Transcript_11157:127-1440(-)|eukprot:CAMPEP_0203646672 /NCGR_PEP_ID=MMETSP0088-20131115/13526_1 /ASSEMBLY_ACC=CAM_ASM_001087 /TAXON_ID=426623 /ORGANISM="Chaetoceros affinis, Strain CCMP159" /LENGTH=437 /DNA_ID=CAMNT_0050503979 /DNA_START=102 /DNA_END=1415 /DNA_ORIENTATION=+